MAAPARKAQKVKGTARAGVKPTQEDPGASKLAKAEAAYKEALEQQAATAEILRVISTSPSDLQPIFDAILKSAMRLCGAHLGLLNLWKGKTFRTVAQQGAQAKFAKWLFERGDVAPVRFSTPMRMYREKRSIQMEDLRGSAAYRQGSPTAIKFVREGNARTYLTVPMLKEGQVIGAIVIYRSEVRPFADRQIALVETFARQAVIAMENVRLLKETKDALERQTATADILKVISGSPTDINPVLRAVAESAARLCDASDVIIRRVDGHLMRAVEHIGGIPLPPETVARPIDTHSTSGRAIRECRTIHIPDVTSPEAKKEYPDGAFLYQRGEGYHSLLVAPMVREGSAIGTIIVRRKERRPFSEQQIKLLETFAAQAVIAIENTRLFNETRQALERQTATAEILQVISKSTTDVQPVLETIAGNARRLLAGSTCGVILVEEGEARMRAIATIPGSEDYSIARKAYPMPLAEFARQRPNFARVMETRKPTALTDAETELTGELLEFCRAAGIRSNVVVPMIRGEESIGLIIVNRLEPHVTTPEETRLLQSFASQAVIAIENVRLFNETKEALEQQTATGEILKVISTSTTDTQPVFEAIVRSAARLFNPCSAGIVIREGELMQFRAAAGADVTEKMLTDLRAVYPVPLDPENSISGRAIVTKQPMWCEDTEAPGVPDIARTAGRLGRFRSFTSIPLVRNDEGIGAIAITSPQPGYRMSDNELGLLRTFADQAVIAIENVRLFNETKEALEQQTATAEILKVISSSPSDTQPVFDSIVQCAGRVFAPWQAILLMRDGDLIRRAARTLDLSPEQTRALETSFPIPFDPQTGIAARAMLEARTIEIPDTDAPDIPARFSEIARISGYRAGVLVPLVKQGQGIGVIILTHAEPGSRLSEKQLALVRTFADQAVIAIENVRLFNETKESLEQQTAIGEVLRVISSSPADVAPVLDTVAARAAKICEASDARVFLAEGAVLRLVAGFGDVPLSMVVGDSVPLDRSTASAHAVVDRCTVHVEDMLGEPARKYGLGREAAEKAGWRTILAVPLMREQRALGALVLRRVEARPFAEKHVALLKTFASQAAIAIENVRLFKETQEALERQTATAEVLKTISRSTFDLDKVLQALLDNAARLGGARQAVMLRPDANGNYVPACWFNWGDKIIAQLRARPARANRDSTSGRVLLEKRPIHIPDVCKDPEYGRQDLLELGSYRSVLSVPMLRDGDAIGLITLTGTDPFTEKQMELITTFADQAVIAIENVRLFREIEEKSTQLEVANKHKSEFLANMSHELRTPLNAIIGFSEVLMDRMFGEVNEKQADYLKDIHESGRHLLSLINDILDLSKIEAGRMELELSSFHLPSAISNAMTLIRERAQRHGIQLGAEVDPRLGEWQADERKVKQILLNLLSNAVKFTPDGGRVEVSAKLDTACVEIAVRDTGIGIAPEDQGVLFEEFKQVGRDTLRKAEGTGLGLALTKKFVELHGGAIRVESAPGKGSTFAFSLPSAAAARPASSG
jgi:GAF domain-containing protein